MAICPMCGSQLVFTTYYGDLELVEAGIASLPIYMCINGLCECNGKTTFYEYKGNLIEGHPRDILKGGAV